MTFPCNFSFFHEYFFNFLFAITEISLLTSNLIHCKACFVKNLVPCTLHVILPHPDRKHGQSLHQHVPELPGAASQPTQCLDGCLTRAKNQGDKHADINIILYLASMLYEYSELLSNFTISDSCSFTRDSRNLSGSGSYAKIFAHTNP